MEKHLENNVAILNPDIDYQSVGTQFMQTIETMKYNKAEIASIF